MAEKDKRYLAVFKSRRGYGDWQIIQKSENYKVIRRHLEREEAVELCEKLETGKIDPSEFPKEFMF